MAAEMTSDFPDGTYGRRANWRDISTAPQEEGETFLTWDGMGVCLGRCTDRGNIICVTDDGEILKVDENFTHWAPLPAPPEDGETEEMIAEYQSPRWIAEGAAGDAMEAIGNLVPDEARAAVMSIIRREVCVSVIAERDRCAELLSEYVPNMKVLRRAVVEGTYQEYVDWSNVSEDELLAGIAAMAPPPAHSDSAPDVGPLIAAAIRKGDSNRRP